MADIVETKEELDDNNSKDKSKNSNLQQLNDD